MEPGEKVYQSHRRLSKCSADFLDFVKENPESMDRSNFGPLVEFNSDYLQTQPWPTFINGETRKEIEDAAIKVYELIASIPDRLFSYDPGKMADYYCLPEDMIKLMLHGVNNDHVSNLLGRGDFAFSEGKTFKCLEYNLNANLGGWEMDILEPMYVNTPAIRKFLQEYNVRLNSNQFFQIFLGFLIDRALERFPANNGGEINVALVYGGFKGQKIDFYSRYLQQKYKSVLETKYGTLGLEGSITVCFLDQLKLISGLPYVNGKRIHVLLDMSGNKVPVVYMEAVRKGELMLYNGPAGKLMGNKLNLALLSEHQESDLFSPEERESIKKYIPWTRKMVPGETMYEDEKIKLEDFVLAERERLVLKAAEGSGGVSVVPGRVLSPEEWSLAVQMAFERKAVLVQEYIESPPYMYQKGKNECLPHQAAWGFFVFGSRYAGGFVRLLPVRDSKGVINSKQGAEESMILEVEE
jgi:hypothetical protein